MDTFQNTVTIAWPADEVFAFLADLRNIIMEWNYAIARTVQTSPGPAGVGASYRQTRTIPRRSEESLQITVFEPPSRPRPGARPGRSPRSRPRNRPCQAGTWTPPPGQRSRQPAAAWRRRLARPAAPATRWRPPARAWVTARCRAPAVPRPAAAGRLGPRRSPDLGSGQRNPAESRAGLARCRPRSHRDL